MFTQISSISIRLALAVVEDLRVADLLDGLPDLHTGNTFHLVDQGELIGIFLLSENLPTINTSGELVRACCGRDHSLCGIAGLRLILLVNGCCNACVCVNSDIRYRRILSDLLRISSISA